MLLILKTVTASFGMNNSDFCPNSKVLENKVKE